MKKNRDLTLVPVVLALAVALFLTIVSSGRAEQPECVGDRHYDGVACCPAQPETTTTTTLPGEPTSCPDPGPCPTVTCDCTGAGDALTINSVTVNRCPDAPIYRRCKRKSDGTIKCPTKFAPKRVFVPETK